MRRVQLSLSMAGGEDLDHTTDALKLALFADRSERRSRFVISCAAFAFHAAYSRSYSRSAGL